MLKAPSDPALERMARRFCFWCHEPVPHLQLCGFCKEVWYCGQVCQLRDWPRHKEECASRELRKRLRGLPAPLMACVRDFLSHSRKK